MKKASLCGYIKLSSLSRTASVTAVFEAFQITLLFLFGQTHEYSVHSVTLCRVNTNMGDAATVFVGNNRFTMLWRVAGGRCPSQSNVNHRCSVHQYLNMLLWVPINLL